MRQLRARLKRNKKNLLNYQGKRQSLKVRILKLRVQVEEFHMKIGALQIKEIRDRRAIDRLDRAIGTIEANIRQELKEKGSLESALLLHRAFRALSRLDGTDILPDEIVGSYVVSGQTRALSRIVTRARHRRNRLEDSRDQLREVRRHEVRLLDARELKESRLKREMERSRTEIALLLKREHSIHEDDRSILRRRNELMALILKLERLRRKEHGRSLHLHPPVPGRSIFRWPVTGKIVEAYGPFHDGIDISSSVGSRVRAAWSGKVLFARPYSGYGRLVILEHGNHLYTLYGHLDRIFAREGTTVAAGAFLGTVGRGGTQGQPTLFFGVTRHGHPLSPMGFLSR